MMVRPIQFVPKPGLALLGQVLEIYRHSFPAEERQPDDILLERFQSGKEELHVALGPDGKVVGFAGLWPLKGTSFCLLDYLAVREDCRGQGWGGAWMRHLESWMLQKQAYLLIEVENPEFGGNPSSKQSRIDFYLHNGAVLLNNVRYLLPDLEGKGKPVEMKLMLFPPIPMNRYNLSQLIGRVHRELYPSQTNQALIDEILQHLPEEIEFFPTNQSF